VKVGKAWVPDFDEATREHNEIEALDGCYHIASSYTQTHFP